MNASPQSRYVLIAGLLGRSQLVARLGNAETDRAIERCLRRVERAALGFKGRLISNSTDESLFEFDSAESAMLAAEEMAQRIGGLPPVSGIALELRTAFDVVTGDGPTDASVTIRPILALAKAGQILTSQGGVAALPKAMQLSTKRLTNLTLPELPATVEVYEIRRVWNEEKFQTIPPSDNFKEMLKTLRPRLKLQFANKELILGYDKFTATLGRDLTSDIQTPDARASRMHGRIECRRDQFVLIDQSTNGTFVTIGDQLERLLKQEELVLKGQGSICCGHSLSDATSESVKFEVLT